MDISAVSSEDNALGRKKMSSSFRQVLDIDITLANILRYLTPHDCIEFLISTKFTYESHLPWWILLCWLKLERYVTNTGGGALIDGHIEQNVTPRSLVSHTVRNLGYACNQCFTPLDGSNGFFAFTSHCNSCSIKIFEQTRSQYVDSTIRFYLCGTDSVITKGKAYISHPYWLTTDNSYESVIEKYGSAFNLAQKMWDEKHFFDTYAGNIDRPRDDKPMSIRKMLEKHFQSAKFPESMIVENDPLQASDFMESGGKDEFERKISNTSKLAAIGEPKWVEFLPQSLRQVYQEQSHSLDCGLSAPSSLGTMPLKELVKTMHMRKFGGIHNP